ncbi:MAG: hypothetical protein GOV15_04655, partial [Candidatus Diapherotrites archaeon]|nr:hypothetical protein [Candidatus Diapherotrites archaeon]
VTIHQAEHPGYEITNDPVNSPRRLNDISYEDRRKSQLKDYVGGLLMPLYPRAVTTAEKLSKAHDLISHLELDDYKDLSEHLGLEDEDRKARKGVMEPPAFRESLALEVREWLTKHNKKIGHSD